MSTHGTHDVSILPSAARTTAQTGVDQINQYGKGLNVVVDFTVFGGSGSITVIIEGKDLVSGKYYTILSSAALAAVATTVLRVYPGLTASANLIASDVLPRTWRVRVAVGNATSHTYSVGASIIG
jgi:hypothetical protein